MGGSNPIRIQSMTNTSTQDTDACVAQAKRIVDAGGEYVRLTTQGVKEAENLMNINAALRQDGYMTPLVADVIAANTTLPVIGVPIKGSVLDGVDALYSIIQMPPGIPVATVAINGAMNAAILAVQMLALSDKELAEAFTAYKEGLKKKIVKANEDLKEVKYEYKTN